MAKILKRLEVGWGEVENKSGNISVMRKDRGKVTVDWKANSSAL